jgi:hypothetical protein
MSKQAEFKEKRRKKDGRIATEKGEEILLM